MLLHAWLDTPSWGTCSIILTLKGRREVTQAFGVDATRHPLAKAEIQFCLRQHTGPYKS